MPAKKKPEKPALATAPDLPERYRMALWKAGGVLADIHYPNGSVLTLLPTEIFEDAELVPDGSDGPGPAIN